MICDIAAYKTYCGIARSYGYDGFLRLETIKATEATGQTVQDYTYAYRPSGNIESIIKRDGRASDGTTSYGCDALYRLKTVSGPESTEDYTYDPLGNRLTASGVTGPWAYNANNELLSYGGTSIQYDLNGNTTQKTGPDGVVWTYLWDLENRLTEVKKDGVTVATYVYDPFGRRLTKTVYENGIPKTTHFAYADEGLVAELNDTGAVTKAYGYYPNGTWTTNPLYLWTAEEVPTGGYYWYLNDHLGTPKALTDELGQLVWTATSEAFGKTTVAAGSAITNNLRFPGQYEDAESGENYNYNRYYQAATGRYITNDPIGFDGGMNLYLYGLDNPTIYADWSGLTVFIKIVRTKYTDNSIIGTIRVYSDITGKVFTGWVLEDEKAGIEHNKLPIPAGVYDAKLRTDKNNPRIELKNVDGYEGIQIHVGNTPDDVEGCFAAGCTSGTDKVEGSRAAMKSIIDIVKADGSGRIKVTVVGKQEKDKEDDQKGCD